MPPALNLLDRIKKKGSELFRQKKPRNVRKKGEEDTHLKVLFNDKRNPYKVFATIPIQYLDSAMDKWLFQLHHQKNEREIKMFNALKLRVPWQKTREFFVNFASNDEPNIVTYFEKYKEIIKDDIEKTKMFIKDRQASSLGKFVFKNPPYVPVYTAKLPIHFESCVVQNYCSEFLPVFESNYKRASWVESKTPIRGIVLNTDFRRARKWTTAAVPHVGNGEWAKAKATWYTKVCKEGRKFVEGMVGYLTSNGDVIVETKEMYTRSLGVNKTGKDSACGKVNDQSLEAARVFLSSAFPTIDVNVIIDNIPKTTNRSLARAMSKVAVFMKRLIATPQVFHARIRQGRYTAEDVLELTVRDMLPEVYENPDFEEFERVKEIITSKRRAIELDFFSMLKDPTERYSFFKQKPLVRSYPKPPLPANCDKMEDPIFFNAGNEMFCLERKFILENKYIPKTRTKIPERIKERALLLKDVHKPEKKPEKALRAATAPGLLNALEEEIDTLKTFDVDESRKVECQKCKRKFHSKNLRSLTGGKMVEFCSIKCFDKYKFK